MNVATNTWAQFRSGLSPSLLQSFPGPQTQLPGFFTACVQTRSSGFNLLSSATAEQYRVSWLTCWSESRELFSKCLEHQVRRSWRVSVCLQKVQVGVGISAIDSPLACLLSPHSGPSSHSTDWRGIRSPGTGGLSALVQSRQTAEPPQGRLGTLTCSLMGWSLGLLVWKS